MANNYTAASINSVDDCSGTINSQGYNLTFVPDIAKCVYTPTAGDQSYVDPLLGPLQFNGGPTPTHALPANCAAVDAADNNTCRSTDQRGFPRPTNGAGTTRCDIGAFELQRTLDLPLVLRN